MSEHPESGGNRVAPSHVPKQMGADGLRQLAGKDGTTSSVSRGAAARPPIASVLQQVEVEASATRPALSAMIGPAQEGIPRRARGLNHAIHQILVAGLIISTVLLLAGLVLDLAGRLALPAATVSPGRAFRLALALDPSGLISLGLLSLMATPIVRVIGSAVVFAREHDWRYTGVTLLVLCVIVVSILLGEG